MNDYDFSEVFKQADALVRESMPEQDQEQAQSPAPASETAPSEPVKSAGNDRIGKFIDAYLPAAQKKAQELGVSPVALLAQAALETGYGKSVIPGTNNLFNIKDPSGKGVAATDNMTGSRDKYRAYGSPDESFNDLATKLHFDRYKGALNTGDDVAGYFSALKKGGYAEDPNYVTSGVNVANVIRARLGDLGKYQGGQADTSAPQEQQARPSRYGEYDPSVDASASAADQQFVTESRQRASDASPISTSLKRGWNQMTDSVGNAYDLAKGNDEGVINRMREADERERLSPQPTANRAWMDSWQKGDTLGWLGNPMGFAGNSVEQLANSAPPMVGSIPGSIVGGAAGASVAGPFGALLGGVIGGAIGSAPGSVAIETGSRIAEMMANDGVDPSNTKMVRDWLSANREKVLREGTIKGLTTAGFDGLMGGIGQRIVAGPMLRFTQASERTLAKMGVDMTDKAAVKAATALPAYKAAMSAPAAELKAATGAAGNAIRGVAEFAGESAGEGLGEYYGEKFATGKGNVDEALLEALMAHGQALVTTAASFAGRKIVGDKYHDQEKAYIDALAAYKAPAQPQPNSPLTNAANAGAAGPGAASPQVSPFGDPELDARHQAIADFLATPGNLDALRNADPNMVGEALHVWRNVINNPNMPMKTRINALNQGYSTLLNVPNFTMPGAQPGAAPTGNLPVPAAGGRPAPVGGTQVGPVDPSAGSIPGQATRVPDAPQSLPRTALPRPMVGAPTQEQPNGASPVIPRPEIPEAAAPSAEAQGTDVPASGIAVQPAVPAGGTGLPGTVEPEVVPQAQEGATAGNAAGEQAAPVAAPRPAPQKASPSPIMARDDIVGAIMRVTGGAGIASKMADTLTGEKAGQGTAKLRGLFTNAGWQDMDKLAEMLRDEEGYDVRDAAHMEDLIRRAAAGDFVRSMARTEKDKAEEADKQHRDEIRRMAAKLGVKTNFVKFGDIEAKVLALMEQRHAKAIELLDSRSRAKFDATLEAAEALLPEDVIEAVMVDVNRRGVHGRDFWNECTKTLRGMIRDAQLERIDESVENAVEGEAPAWLEEGDEQGDQQPGGGSAVDQGNEAEPAEVAGSGSAEEVAPSFDLAGQTPDEILAEQGRQIVERERQRREAQNERDREKRAENRKEQERRAAAVIAEREAAKKAEVDALANNFALGQEAPAPVEKKVSTEEAAGQKDIFASPAPANEEFARGQAMFAEGIDELISLLGGKTNMLPEEETRLLPIMSKILRGAAVMGYESFKDAARFVINTLREKAPDVADKLEIKNLQAGYINLNGFDPKSGIGDFASIDELMADHDALVESVEKAEKHTDTNPSPAQKEAENYRTGKFQWNGLTISVETAKGQDRTDKETNGEKWRVTMPATYGRILGTIGADEDHVDVFVGPNLLSPKVFVIDQNQVDSKIFDEHKTFIGYDTAEQAQADYLNSFTGNFGGRVFGQISDAITVDELKDALPALQEKKPFTEPAVPVLKEGEYVALSLNSGKDINGVVISAMTTSGGNVRYDIRTGGAAAQGGLLETRVYSQDIKAVSEQREATDDEINGRFGAESEQKSPDSESVVALPKPDRTEIVAERIEQTSTGVKVFGPNLDDLADRARSIYGKGVVKRKDGITIATKDPASAKGVFPLRNEFYTLPGLPERYAPIKVAVYEDGAQLEGVNFGYVSPRVPNIADAIEQYRKGYESNPEKSESATAEKSSGVAEEPKKDTEAQEQQPAAPAPEEMPQIPAATPLASFSNGETGMSSMVVSGSKEGTFNVVLRDDDSGEYVPTAVAGFDSMDKAIAKARQIVGLPAEDTEIRSATPEEVKEAEAEAEQGEAPAAAVEAPEWAAKVAQRNGYTVIGKTPDGWALFEKDGNRIRQETARKQPKHASSMSRLSVPWSDTLEWTGEYSTFEEQAECYNKLVAYAQFNEGDRVIYGPAFGGEKVAATVKSRTVGASITTLIGTLGGRASSTLEPRISYYLVTDAGKELSYVNQEWMRPYDAALLEEKPAAPAAEPAAPAPSAEKPLAGVSIGSFKHTRTGVTQYAVAFKGRVERDVFDSAKAIASRYKARYSSFRGQGAIPGFLFDDEAKAKKFAAEMDRLVPSKGEAKPVEPATAAKPVEQNATPEVADNEVFRSPYIYRKELNGWTLRHHGTPAVNANSLKQDAPIIAELERDLEGRKPKQPKPKKSSADALLEARNDLIEMQSLSDSQFIADDRLLERIRRQKRYIADLEKDAAPAAVDRTPEEYQSKAASMFAAMDDNAKIGVRNGLFPAPLMAMAEREGYADSSALSSALMDAAKRDRAKPAAIENAGNSAIMESKEIDNANAIPESVGNDGQGVSGERAAGDVPQDEGGRGTGRRSEDAGEGGRRVVHGSERGNLGQGTEGDRSTSEDRPAGENPVHGDAGKPDRRGSAVSNARLPKRGNGAGGRDYLAPEGSLTRKGSWLETAKRNVEIIKLVKKLDSEGRMATPEEQAVIAQYVGFGASEMANGLFPLKTTWVSSGRVRGRSVTLDEVNESALKPGWKEVYYDLKESVSDEDMKAIRSSTQFAHFTSEKVIRSIWSAVNQLGFDGGKIVEPGMGTGLFMVASPEGMAAASKYVGIERDYVTASIAKHLLQAQNVIRNDFIAQNLPDGHFDLAIGNPPFASWEVTADPRYRKNRFKLHDYFFAKTIDKVRPGGLLVFVTSKGTMDKLDDKARSFLAERADLVGAVRLPQTAFKGNAGTEVVTDVIFLKKRAVGAGPSGPAWAGMKEVSTPQGPTLINEYFADHPEMVLGRHELTGTMYRSNQYTVVPMDGDIEEHFAQAVTKLPKGIYEPAQEKKEGATKAEQEKSDRREFDVGGKKEGGMYVAEDGELMQVVNGVGEPLSNTIPLTDKDRVWLKGYVGLRDALKTAMRDQLSDGDWQKSLAVLQKTYAAFTAKHGRIFEHTRYERTFADEAGDEETRVYRRFKWNHLLNSKVDVEVTLMNGLEDISETSEEVTDGDVLKGRVLARRGAAEINTIDDAFAVTLNDLGHLDIPRIASLMNVSEEEATGLLGDLVYEDPVVGWQTADEYLSGNVLKKLEEAEVAASTDPRFERNVQALIAAQPAPLGPDRIVVRLGANWIGPHVVTQFTDEAFEEKAKVTYDPRTNIWRVEGETLRRNRTAGAEWGTSDRSMPEILSAVLNNQSITVRRTDQNKKTYTDKEATAKANDIAEKMRQRFASWVWTDAARTDELLTIYNRKFNNLAPRKFDGKHMKLPGLSLRYSLYDHQLRAIWRIVQTGNSYLAHAVGAGKAQPLDAKVLTPTGWRLMGDIQPGDYVIAGDGTPTLVEAVFPQGEKEIFRITFSDGSNTECCDEHLWMTQTYKERGYAQKAKKAGKEWACAKGKIRSLAEIRETLVSDHLGAKNHSIPMVGAVQFQTSDLPLDPYLMGVLLGNGSMSAQHISISSGDPQIIELCAPLLPQNAVFNVKKGDGCPTWNIARKKAIGYGANMEPNPVVHVLRSLGLQGRKSADKFIPDAYKMASVEQRIAVLQGLLDTDGSVSKRGHSVYFYTVSDSLADDVQFIVRSLGGTVSRAVKKSPSFMHNGEKRTGQPCHVMCLKLPSDIAPFRISRKAELHRTKTSYGPVRYIVNVEPVGKKQAQCIRVDHPEHLYVTDDFIVTHNTLEMIVSAMEQKRLGLINKPMFVVPNHMLDQFANEFQSAYPAARILVADKDNFTGDARRRFVAKAALNDWDAIIIKQSSFGLIGIQQSTADSVADDILMELDAALDGTDKDDRVTRKKLEAQIDSVRQRVNALAGQGDKNITFEEMGVDFLYIDEAHQFRKLDFATNRQVKGIDPNGSKGAFGLFAKMRFLESKHAGRSAVLASGTPITNTIAELYTIQRYLDYTGLEEDGLVAFDAWANNYGAVAFEWERNAAAEFEKVERFSKFVNVPELMMRVRKFMDVLTMEQLGDFVTRPAVKGGGPEMVTAQKSEALEKYMREDLLPRLQASKAWKPSKDEPFNPDPVIAIGTDGRLAAIDARFADKSLKDDPGSKLNLMIDDIIAEYKATNGNVYTTDGKPDRIDGGAQIVFSSVGFGDAVEQNRGFSPRKWMMKRLKDAGIPSSEVAFMGDYKTDKQKEAMFKDMREGRKRILVGSPANMGTGVNVQKRLTKLHFLAPPWYPADVEQPHGRILRQGNENKEVGLRWYLTEGTYDSTMWGMVRRKGRAIEQAFRGDGARTIEDISEVSSYAMAEAVSAGDDRVIKLAEAQATVEKYQRLKNAHFSEQRQLRHDVSLNESRASWARKQILGLDESKRLQAEANFKYWEPLPVTIDNVTVNKAGDIGAKIGTQIAKVFADGSAGEHVIGKVLGTFDLVADLSPAAINNSEKDEVSLSLRVGPTELTIDDSCSLGLWAMKDEVGLGQKIKNAMVRVGERLNEAQRDLEDAESKLKKQRSRIGAPFSDDAALAQAIADAATIQAELVGESVKKQQDRANGAKAAAPAAKPNEAGKDDGETPSALRRSPDANAERIPFGVDAPTANTVVSRLFSALGTSLPNTVVDSFHELPDEVQAEARAQGGDAKTTKGVFHRGTVYFVANNHDSIADLEETVLHEAIGHAGLRKLLGPEFVQKLNALFASLGGISGLSKIAAENGFGSIYDEYIRSVADAQAKDPAKYTDAIAKLILTEEVFAHIAQNRPTLMSKVKALIGWVRDWLRSHGFAKLAEYGETDVLNLLNRVKKNLRDPNGDGPKGGMVPATARVGDPIQSRGFDAEAAPTVLRRSPMEAARDFVTTPEGRKKITERIADIFRKTGTFNVWHKTFGSQFHKAKIDADFRPVYELAQKYHDDISRFAVEAADMAPDLLPKLDKVSDAIRGFSNWSRDTKDAKAISEAIFTGTLEDEKVYSDRELADRFNLDERQVGLYRQYRAAVDRSMDDLAKAEMAKLAKTAGIEEAPKDLSVDESSSYYIDQLDGAIQEAEDRVNLLGKLHADQLKALEVMEDIDAYNDIRDALNDKQAADMKYAQDKMAEVLAMRDGFAQRAARVAKMKQEGYAPLMRFGKYTVDVVEVDADGNEITYPITAGPELAGQPIRHFFSMFESKAEAAEAAKMMREEYPTAKVTEGIASEEAHTLFSGVNPGTIEMLAQIVGAEDEVMQRYLKMATASRSAMKRLIHRKKIAGHSEDVTRTLASFIVSNARAASASLNFGGMLEAANAIPKEKGDVKDEAVKLINYIRNPQEEASGVRGLLFAQYIGGSLASALVNLTQTATTTFPFLHQFGGTVGDLMAAAKMAGGKALSGKFDLPEHSEIRSVIQLAEEEGVLSPHNIHALMGESVRPGLLRNRFMRNFMHLWGAPFSMAESFNREVAFIAAFNVAKRNGKDREAAYQFAKNAVEETQFVYSKASRPNWARGAVGATLFTFKSFSVFYLELMKRLPAKERAIMMATMILLAGVGGLPAADDLDDLVDTLGQRLGYDTNSKRAKDEFARRVLGKTGAEFLLNGVSAFLPMDVQRLGMGNLIPGSSAFKRSETDRSRDALEFFGAAGSQVKALFDSVDYATNGQAFKAVTNAIGPKALKDAFKGAEMADTGIYTDTKGRRVADVTMGEAAMKAIGFQPSSVKDIQEQKSILMQDVNLAKEVRSAISELWAQGRFEKDQQKVAKAKLMLEQWNARNPDTKVQVNVANVQRRVHQMELTAAERMRKAVPKTMKQRAVEAFD